MKNLSSPKVLKKIIELYGFRFSKSLGQNFLIDANYVKKIVDGADVSGKNVLEIGPGVGTISEVLKDVSKKLLLIEIDSALIPVLNDNFSESENVEIIRKDILKVDLKEISKNHFDGEKFSVVSNLPYYITTPVLEKIIEENVNCESFTVMVQKEVADRMLADEKSKEYSALSLFIKFNAECKKLFDVPKSVFMPKPKIDSSVLKLTPRIYDEKANAAVFKKLVRAGFNQRRKTILNSFSTLYDKEKLKEVFQKTGINEMMRAENLSIEDFIKLADEF